MLEPTLHGVHASEPVNHTLPISHSGFTSYLVPPPQWVSQDVDDWAEAAQSTEILVYPVACVVVILGADLNTCGRGD